MPPPSSAANAGKITFHCFLCITYPVVNCWRSACSGLFSVLEHCVWDLSARAVESSPVLFPSTFLVLRSLLILMSLRAYVTWAAPGGGLEPHHLVPIALIIIKTWRIPWGKGVPLLSNLAAGCPWACDRHSAASRWWWECCVPHCHTHEPRGAPSLCHWGWGTPSVLGSPAPFWMMEKGHSLLWAVFSAHLCKAQLGLCSLDKSIEATITKFCRLGGDWKKQFISHCSEGWSQRSGCQCRRVLVSTLLLGELPVVPQRDWSHCGGFTIMTWPPPKDPTSWNHHTGGLEFQHMNMRWGRAQVGGRHRH